MTRAKSIKRFLIAAVIALFTVATFFLLKDAVIHFGKKIIDQRIQEILPADYSLRYQSFHLDWSTRRLAIHKLILFPEKKSAEETQARQLELFIPEFSIQLKSFLPFFLKKELIIEGIQIQDPEVHIQDVPFLERPNISGTSISLFQVLTSYLNLLQIDQFGLNRGYLQYQTGLHESDQQLILENIDIIISEFLVDSSMAKHQFLNAESVKLVITDQKLHLPDGIHELSFSRFTLDSKDSLLQFENLELSPNHPLSLPLLSYFHSTIPAYQLKIPSLLFKGVDYETTYLDQQLNVREAILKNAYLTVSQGIKPKEAPRQPSKNQQQDALYELIANLAPRVNIQKIILEAGEIGLDLHTPGNLQCNWEVSNLELNNFSINPDMKGFWGTALPFQSIKGKVSNYRQLWPDGKHTLLIGNLSFDSQKQTLEASDMHTIPTFRTDSDSKVTLKQHLKFLKISGINLLKFWGGESIDCNHIILDGPETMLETQSARQKTYISENPLQVIREAASGFFVNSLHAKKVSIINGSLRVNDILQIDNYQLKANDLCLSSHVNSWNQMIPELSLSVDGLTFRDQFGILQMEGAQTNGSDHTMTGIQIDWKTENRTIKSEVASFYVFGAQLDSLLSGTGTADSSILISPSIDIKVMPELIGDPPSKPKINLTIPHLKSKQFRLVDGTLHYEKEPQEKLTCSKLNALVGLVDSFSLEQLSFDSLALHTKRFDFPIILSSLNQESPTTYLLNDLVVHQNLEPGCTPIIRVPKVKIYGFVPEKLISEGSINLEKCHLMSPQFHLPPDLKIPDSTPENSSFSPSSAWGIDTLLISNGAIQWIPKKVEAFQFLQTRNFSFAGTGIRGNANRLNQHKGPFSLETFHWKSDSTLEISFPNGNLQIGHAAIEGPVGNVLLSNISGNYEIGHSTLSTPLFSVALKNLDFPELLQENKLYASQIQVDFSSLQVNRRPEQFFSRELLQKKTAILFREVHLDSIEITCKNIEYEPDTLLDLKNLNGYFLGFQLDSTNVNKSMESWFEKGILTLKEIGWELGTFKEYRGRCSAHYDLESHRLVLDQLTVKPKISLFEHSLLHPVRTDYLNLSADSLIFNGFSSNTLLKVPLSIPFLEVIDLRLSIIRNEKMPLNTKYKGLLQEQIQSIPFAFKIDESIVFASVHYSSLPAPSGRPAYISLSDLKVGVSNLSNTQEDSSNPLKLAASGKLYNESPFNLEAQFFFNDTTHVFDVSGQINHLHLPVLNKIITPLSRIRIQKGKSKSIHFDMSANPTFAIGEMTFKYSNLKINLVNKDDESQMGLGNSIRSFWINQVVKSNNPVLLRPRKGIIYYERDTSKETLHFIIHSLLSGMVSSAGVQNNRRKLREMGIDDLEILNYEVLFGDIIQPATKAHPHGRKKGGHQ